MDARPFDTSKSRVTLPLALLGARNRFGGDAQALEDPERNPLTYDRLILGAFVLGRKLDALAGEGTRVGVLLPNVNGAVVAVFGLLFHDRVPVMLNFTAGAKNLVSACQTAEVSTIITSRRFIDTAKLDETLLALEQGRRILYLEDIRKEIGVFDKISGVIRAKLAGFFLSRLKSGPDDAAAVLFTSGSEGLPKGVVLSHANIAANAAQIWAHAEGMLTNRDIAFNPLPIFHSFGLTAGLMLGLFNGMKVVLYPSPLHYKQVPKLIGQTKATLLFATDTFLVGYARAADEHDLDTLRLVVTGAEKVKDATRKLWSAFPTTILEGYGCTECSPVLACCTPTINRLGTVGRLLPGVEARLDPVEGITTGGKLVVRGPNVMAGYMFAAEPGVLKPLEQCWHDTGDIVNFDMDGFCTILGRAKRFAKIGGEMVSLAAVETIAADLWPGATHVAVSLPDPKKGEQIVLVTEAPDADRATLLTHAQQQGFPELYVPRAILVVAAIPVLGSGKVDYGGSAELARKLRALI